MFTLEQATKVEAQLNRFFNLDTRWGRWPTPSPGRFIPVK